MLLKVLHVCYDPSHNGVQFGPIKIEDVDSSKPATKIVRAILRGGGLEPDDYLQHELHKCHCNKEKGKKSYVANPNHPSNTQSKLKQESLVDKLDLKSGDRIFIKPSKGKGKEKPAKRSAPSTSRTTESQSPRKRPRTSESSSTLPAGGAPNSSFILSNGVGGLTGGNWTPVSETIRDSISEMTGGNRWLYQKIVDGVQLTSRSEPRLRSLRRAVALAYELPETAKEKRDGGLPRILCKGLAKAFRRRLRLHEASKEAVTGGKAQHLRHIGLNDLDETVEWLAHKLEDPNRDSESEEIDYDEDLGEEEEEDEEDLPAPELTRSALSTVRRISELWRNDKWLSQPPLPGLAPISVSNNLNNGRLRKIAELTKVKASDVQPEGLPNVALRALRTVILSQTSELIGNAKHGWSQSKCIPLALEMIEKGRVSKKPLDPLDESIESYSKNRKQIVPPWKPPQYPPPTASTSKVKQEDGDNDKEKEKGKGKEKETTTTNMNASNFKKANRHSVLSSRTLVPYSRPTNSNASRSSLRNNPTPITTSTTTSTSNNEVQKDGDENGNDEDNKPSPHALLQQCRSAFNACSNEFGYSLEQEVEVLRKISELEVLLESTIKPKEEK